jgi:endonuclease/exonuclease/phosphatase family metal-dependent hydrolase
MRPRRALLPLATALLAGCGPAAPPPAVRGAAVVRLATWNVHDLFDEVDRLEPPGALDEVPAAAEVEAHLAAVAAVLSRVEADAVLLQEVEDRGVLERLAARCGYPEAHLLEGNDPRGIDVALLSRLPVAAYLGHAGDLGPDGRLLWPRDAVEAVLVAGGQPVVLVGTHLSSRLSDPAGLRRAQQAARLRALADGAAARWGAAVAVAGGDLNDEASAPALAPLLGDGAWLDAAAAAPDGAWTWSDGAGRAALDHLAVRADAAGALLAAQVVGGADVAAASDHRPLVIDVLLR